MGMDVELLECAPLLSHEDGSYDVTRWLSEMDLQI